MHRCLSVLAVSALLAGPLAAAPAPAPAKAPAGAKGVFQPKKSKIPDAEVTQAIDKGIAFLKTQKISYDWAALAFYTLFHGGVAHDDPAFVEHLKYHVDREPDRTYRVTLAAMCLSELDKIGYQWKLIDYAQFLVDTQCQNGQWHYGDKIPLERPKVDTAVETPGGGNTVKTPGPGDAAGAGAASAAPAVPPALYGVRPPLVPAGAKGRTYAKRRILIQQHGRKGGSGDNSNSQYAALGLRACAEAGLEIDPLCIADALKWWETTQHADGGWNYTGAGGNPSYGSMSAGGLGAVVIYHWMQGKPAPFWRNDKKVLEGLEWMNKNWDVTKNPHGIGEAEGWLYYYLYAIERAGMLYGTDYIGSHDWYDEGAAFLLKQQTPDGSWPSGKELRHTIWNTCYAILFLKRATQALPPRVYTR